MVTFLLQIDIAAVAEARGYKHTGSVANRINKLKKRYNLPITASGAKKLNSSAGDTTIPVTPNKSKITKARTTRGRAIKVPKKLVKSDDESSRNGSAMITAAPKKPGKFATVVSGESGDDEDGNFICKGEGKTRGKAQSAKSSDVEEGEVSQMEEDGDDLENSQFLKVQSSDDDEV
jgi:hypothetical protein